MYIAVVGPSADVKLAGVEKEREREKKRGAGALSVTTTTLEQIGNNIIQKVEIFSDISANGLLDHRHISKLEYIEEIMIRCC